MAHGHTSGSNSNLLSVFGSEFCSVIHHPKEPFLGNGQFAIAFNVGAKPSCCCIYFRDVYIAYRRFLGSVIISRSGIIIFTRRQLGCIEVVMTDGSFSVLIGHIPIYIISAVFRQSGNCPCYRISCKGARCIGIFAFTGFSPFETLCRQLCTSGISDLKGETKAVRLTLSTY